MKRIKLTMAQALLKFLDNQYVSLDGVEYKFVQGIFGIYGHGNVTGLGQAFEEGLCSLPYLRVQNEQGGVHAAIAYAKQRNKLGIYAVTSSIGPGATNMLTGAATATTNRIPVLLLPGDIFACRQPDPVLQQLEVFSDYTLSVNDCFKPVSRYWDRIMRPEQLMTAMLNAMRVLTDPVDTGAVTICLPQDVQDEAYEYPEEFFKKRVFIIDRRVPTKESIARAADIISKKSTPYIISGGGVIYSLAEPELQRFCESFGIPVGSTQAGKGALSWKHPMDVGGTGVMGTKAANILAREADVIIAIGTRLMDFTTVSKAAFQNPNVEIVHINVCRFDALKMDGVEVVADAKLALIELEKELKARGYKTSDAYQNKIKMLKEEWNKEVDRLYALKPQPGSNVLPQTAVLGKVNEVAGDDGIVVCAAGSLPGDLTRIWRTAKRKRFHLEYAYSCMGYEIAGAMGVKMAEPDSEVFVVIGDGSYLMLHTEILTTIMEKRKIIIVMFDSVGFNCIESLSKSQGASGYGNRLCIRDDQSKKLTGTPVEIDFAANAKSYGAVAYKANSLEELEECLSKAKKETKTVLIETKVGIGTMSPGYESWWRVGVSEVSSIPSINEAYKKMQEMLKKTRDY